MRRNPQLVFRGFLELPDDEKSKLIEAIYEYREASYDQKKEIESNNEAICIGVVVGPNPFGCPCCGK